MPSLSFLGLENLASFIDSLDLDLGRISLVSWLDISVLARAADLSSCSCCLAAWKLLMICCCSV